MDSLKGSTKSLERVGVGREDRANECREDNCCKEGERRWRMGRVEGRGEGERKHLGSLW